MTSSIQQIDTEGLLYNTENGDNTNKHRPCPQKAKPSLQMRHKNKN